MPSTVDSKPPLLRAENLVKAYRRKRVVDKVSLTVKPGEIVGLLGPNGAGKTTSFRMIVGMVPADEGRVFLEDEDMTNMYLSNLSL